MSVLGFDFHQGPEVPVPPPFPLDFTLDRHLIQRARIKWAEELRDQINLHNAWAILIVKPNLDVLLYDTQSVYKATGWGGTAHLLLAREVTHEHKFDEYFSDEGDHLGWRCTICDARAYPTAGD